jgi:hypothetical protein
MAAWSGVVGLMRSITMNKNTPLPGQRVTPVGIRETQVTQRFLARFNSTFADGKIKTPTFLALVDKPHATDSSIFSSPDFLKYDTLYFSNGDSGKYLHKAKPSEIFNFFSKMQPWDDGNYYIFDEEYDWCIIFTHERTLGIVGNFPLSE